MVDFKELKLSYPIEDVIGRYVKLRKAGSQLQGQCPFHTDVTPSMYVRSDHESFKCFGCGASGDVFDFVQRIEGLDSPKAAAEWLKGGQQVTQRTERDKPVEWVQLNPAPTEPDFGDLTFRGQQPVKWWCYRNADGSINSYDVRFEHEDGTKDVLPLSYGSEGEAAPRWRFRGANKPRPLYNLPKVTGCDIVVMAEGCKVADALDADLPANHSATSWQLGYEGTRYCDIEPLRGKMVFFWPDNDIQGQAAAIIMNRRFHNELGQPLCIIHNPVDMPRGWDYADGGIEDVMAYMYENSGYMPLEDDVVLHCPAGEKPPKRLTLIGGHWSLRDVDQEIVHEVDEVAEQPSEPSKATNDLPAVTNDLPQHFTVLGFERAEMGKQYYVFFQHDKRVIIRKTAEGLSKSALLELAPLEYWLTNWRADGKHRIDEDGVKDALIREAEARGIFDLSDVRGRGAWYDSGKVVLHAGDRLVVDGQSVPLGEFKGQFMYEASTRFKFTIGNPLTNTEAAELLNFARDLPWERELNAYLLAGWCVIAPVCGALTWRPHIWVTGSAGSGKSWTLKRLIRSMVGFCSINVQGKSSEPGIRQKLGVDSLPVVFDEAEANTDAALKQIENILQLVRSASSDDGGDIIMGSSQGTHKEFKIRSCFAFASISVPLQNQSDRRRVSVLGMTRDFKMNRYELEKRWAEVCTEDYPERLFSRTLSMMPIILDNIKVFTRAAAVVLDDQAMGDQVGAMLAGAYSLTSGGQITYEKAIEWIKQRDWNQEKSGQTRDEIVLLIHLMQQEMDVQTTEGLRLKRTVGELVSVASGADRDDMMAPLTADAELKRAGFKVEGGKLIISNSTPKITRWLKDTAFSRNHNKILARIDGAEELATVRFSAGSRTRAVSIPLEVAMESLG